MQKKTNKANVRVLLLAYDTVILMLSYLLLLIFYHGEKNVSYLGVLEQFCLSFVCGLATRVIGKIYRQI